jgi:hypothetical protein
MRRVVFASALVLIVSAMSALPVLAQGRVEFEGAVGVIPISRNAGTAEAPVPGLNIVQGVNPAGQPWILGRLNAEVSADGRINVEGRGLVLAGGNSIGTIGGTTSVSVRLFCGGVAHNSPSATLHPGGAFDIEGTLSPVPPNPCANPVLLVMNQAGTSWFAAGILKVNR